MKLLYINALLIYNCLESCHLTPNAAATYFHRHFLVFLLLWSQLLYSEVPLAISKLFYLSLAMYMH